MFIFLFFFIFFFPFFSFFSFFSHIFSSLPPPVQGFVLKSDIKRDEGPVLTLEEIIETEREKIKNGTPVTLASFAEWKKKKDEEKLRKVQVQGSC